MDALGRLLTPEYGLFDAGIFFLLMALFSAISGICPGRGGPTYRARDPKGFWIGVFIYSAGGLFFWFLFANSGK
jgi:hypothetical protein